MKRHSNLKYSYKNLPKWITKNQLYIDKIIKQEHNFIYLNNKCEYDIDVNKWALSKFDRKTLKYNNTERVIQFVN